VTNDCDVAELQENPEGAWCDDRPSPDRGGRAASKRGNTRMNESNFEGDDLPLKLERRGGASVCVKLKKRFESLL